MTIKNAEIITKLDEMLTEKIKPDVDKAPLCEDIQDWCEAHVTAGISVRRDVPGVFIQGTSIIINGRPTLLINIATFLSTEDTSDLLSMRDALAAHFNAALAALKTQKGSAP